MKNVLKLVILITVIIGFAGCGWQQGIKVSKIKAASKNVYVPKLNVVSTVEVGQNMFQKAYLYYPAANDVKLLEPAIGRNGNIWVDSTKNIATSAGTTVGWQKKRLRAVNDPLATTKKVNAMCYSPWICLTDIKSIGSFTHFSGFGISDYTKLNKPAKYEIVPAAPMMNFDSFKYIVLYQGKKGNLIKVSYREFKNDMARPAFTQDIEYELDSDGTALIGFKGLRIKISKVTNLDITYKVIKDYN